jgi:catalase
VETTSGAGRLTASSVLFDAVYIPGWDKSIKALMADSDAGQFISEAYKHCKTIGASGEGAALLEAAGIGTGKAQPGQKEASAGVVVGKGSDTSSVAAEFIKAVAQHRHWSRERKE